MCKQSVFLCNGLLDVFAVRCQVAALPRCVLLGGSGGGVQVSDQVAPAAAVQAVCLCGQGCVVTKVWWRGPALGGQVAAACGGGGGRSGGARKGRMVRTRAWIMMGSLLDHGPGGRVVVWQQPGVVSTQTCPQSSG